MRTNKYDLGVPVQSAGCSRAARKGLHLTPRQLSRLFHEAADAAGIKKTVDAACAAAQLCDASADRGIDIRMIQALLGHAKLETTARYTRVATGLITAVESPLDRLSHAAQRERRKPSAARPSRRQTVAGADVPSSAGGRGHLPRPRSRVA